MSLMMVGVGSGEEWSGNAEGNSAMFRHVEQLMRYSQCGCKPGNKEAYWCICRSS